jgi:hypothetical protein
MKSKISFLLLLLSLTMNLMAQIPANYDESKVPHLVLPDPFVGFAGNPIVTAEDWENIRRPQIMMLFEENVYGQIPKDFESISFTEIKDKVNDYSDIAIFKEIEIVVSRNGNNHKMRLNVFIPKEGKGPFPVFMLINHRYQEPLSELVETGFWPIVDLIEKGYATASFDVDALAPDDPEKFTEGILQALYPEQLNKKDGMRALGAWAWGAMRAMDYFEKDALIDAEKAIIVGHSRGGKAALWASANDTRWAVTVSNESGCGGATLSRRKFGETVHLINNGFPFWFNDNFKEFNGKEEMLPVDQHMLVSLIAPRAVYFSSARGDRWADPKGEYLSIKFGSRIYPLIYGKEVNFPLDFEEQKEPIIQPYAGYHIREGKHNLTLEDWKNYMDFVEVNLGKK